MLALMLRAFGRLVGYIVYNSVEDPVTLLPLVWTDNLWVHPRKMVVDVVLLLVRVSLDES
jgi:hypothetical protein